MAILTLVAVLVFPASSLTVMTEWATSPVVAVKVISVSEFTECPLIPVVALFTLTPEEATGLAGRVWKPLPVITAVPPFLIEFLFTELTTGAILSTVSC